MVRDLVKNKQEKIKCCENINLIEYEYELVCNNCGTIHEENRYVSEELKSYGKIRGNLKIYQCMHNRKKSIDFKFLKVKKLYETYKTRERYEFFEKKYSWVFYQFPYPVNTDLKKLIYNDCVHVYDIIHKAGTSYYWDWFMVILLIYYKRNIYKQIIDLKMILNKFEINNKMYNKYRQILIENVVWFKKNFKAVDYRLQFFNLIVTQNNKIKSEDKPRIFEMYRKICSNIKFSGHRPRHLIICILAFFEKTHDCADLKYFQIRKLYNINNLSDPHPATFFKIIRKLCKFFNTCVKRGERVDNVFRFKELAQ